MAVLVLAASSIAVAIPTAIYVALLYWLDRNEREPLSLLAMAFGWGAFPAVVFAVVTSLIADLPLSLLGRVGAELMSTTAVAPVVEEIAKGFIVVVVFKGFRKEFDGPLDGIVYGAVVGCGFSMVENFLYLTNAWFESGWGSWATILLFRALVFGLNHAFFTGLTGLGLGLARLSRSASSRLVFAAGGLGAAIFFHAVHNLGASLAHLSCLGILVSVLSDWGGILLVVVVIVISLWQERKWISQELQEEVASGLLTDEEYAFVCSRRIATAARTRAASSSLPNSGKRSDLVRLATRLAFKKHQSRVRGDDDTVEIGQLRASIASLRPAVS